MAHGAHVRDQNDHQPQEVCMAAAVGSLLRTNLATPGCNDMLACFVAQTMCPRGEKSWATSQGGQGHPKCHGTSGVQRWLSKSLLLGSASLWGILDLNQIWIDFGGFRLLCQIAWGLKSFSRSLSALSAPAIRIQYSQHCFQDLWVTLSQPLSDPKGSG